MFENHREWRRRSGAMQKTLTVVAVGLVAGCSSMGNMDMPTATALQGSTGETKIRPPAVGQHWVYDVRDLYTDKIVDQVTETVVSVQPNIRIKRVSQKMGRLPDDVQSTWGAVVQDSHWSGSIVFSEPVPEWPADLSADHSTNYRVQYSELHRPESRYWWTMTMRPHDWESVSVPAGQFKTLYFTDQINFEAPDFYTSVDNHRLERVWFAPQVGRWVLRRGTMDYREDGEPGRMYGRAVQWELKAWS